MNRRLKSALSTLAVGLGVLTAFSPSVATAAEETRTPGWSINSFSYPTNFIAGTPGGTQAGPAYYVVARNSGTEETSGNFTIIDTLPPQVTIGAEGASAVGSEGSIVGPISCDTVAQTVTCTGSGALQPDEWVKVGIPVDVGAAEGPIVNEASVSGGGAPEGAAISVPSAIESALPPFGFLPGLPGLHTQASREGLPAVGAGSHPAQLSLGMSFPTRKLTTSTQLAAIEDLRDATAELPAGLIANPNAVPKCTEAQLESRTCPPASQVGVAMVSLFLLDINPRMQMVYNMVPPPGSAAALGFDVGNLGVFAHVLAGVHSENDFRAFGAVKDITAKAAILEADITLWGKPNDKSHDYRRSGCLSIVGSCPEEITEPSNKAFLTLPSRCSGPIETTASVDSWQHPGVFKEASVESTDAAGTPIGVQGCNGLQFKPTIESRPTTNLTDSPAGLDFDLKQALNLEYDGPPVANLRDATVTLPPGLTANPAQASGLEACSTTQIGYRPREGKIHFSEEPDECPGAAKIGTVEAITPLLDDPIPGDIYIAKPFENPFNSLLSIYISIEDPQTGIIAKLAGKVTPDPVTGQLSTRFTENPDLPLEDVKVHLFGGSRGSLITPPVCGSNTSTSALTPWSSPEGPDMHPSDSFATTTAPGGGSCPTTEAQMPNAPAFTAGTLSPQAGAFSTLLFKLTREDGSQRLSKIEATLPAGLSARLRGVSTCSEADIAKALAREQPNQGAAEQADPSCPASSEVGVVTVGAGAGPTPYYTQGRAYLAGPYKGAPVSFVFITPAVAGPFDLGAVVARTAVYLDNTTAQARAVSDPLPTILHGIPLDVRSVALKVARPQFTLNPTSCDRMGVSGGATSTLGQVAPLASPFQVGGCKALRFAPKMQTRLFGKTNRGAHPRLRTVLTAKPGEANIARVSFALPHSEFIDQSHFRTICTRVQYAANQCPAGAIYGYIKAKSPLVDYTVEGPIYLRSSTHELPDVVAALRGPASQPVAIDLVGHVDSVNGGIRTIFETVPDLPVSKAIVTLQGGKKGLFQNSTNICKGDHRATVKMIGQNGKAHNISPVLKADCRKKVRKK